MISSFYKARRAGLGVILSSPTPSRDFKNLPLPEFFTVFHREEKLSWAKIANLMGFIKKLLRSL
jgi:hypothetical protein